MQAMDFQTSINLGRLHQAGLYFLTFIELSLTTKFGLDSEKGINLISHHGRVREHIDRQVAVLGHGTCFLEQFPLRAGLRVITSVESTRREARSYTLPSPPPAVPVYPHQQNIQIRLYRDDIHPIAVFDHVIRVGYRALMGDTPVYLMIKKLVLVNIIPAFGGPFSQRVWLRF